MTEKNIDPKPISMICVKRLRMRDKFPGCYQDWFNFYFVKMLMRQEVLHYQPYNINIVQVKICMNITDITGDCPIGILLKLYYINTKTF